MLAPVGYSRLMDPGGEVVAAGEAGTGYILSTISGHKLESVRAATNGRGISSIWWAEGKRQRAQLSAHAKQDFRHWCSLSLLGAAATRALGQTSNQ
jgi:hypothetical protein